MSKSCCGEELVAISSSIACLIAKDASVDELTLLSAVFELVSNALLIIANSRDIVQQCEEQLKAKNTEQDKIGNIETGNSNSFRIF